MKYLSDEAAEFVASAEQEPEASDVGRRRATALGVLDAELSSGRRLVPGALAVVLAFAGGLLAGLGTEMMFGADVPSDAGVGAWRAGGAVVLVLGIALLVVAVVMAVRLLRSGHAVVEAYRWWASADGSSGPRRLSAIYTRLFRPDQLVRGAITGVGFVAAVFAWSVTIAAVLASDPIGIDGAGRLFLVAAGAIWAITFTVVVLAVGGGDIRLGSAHGRHVAGGSR